MVGPNADSETLLGDWAVPQEDADVTTVLEGIREQFPNASIESMCFDGRISYVNASSIRTAAMKAASADLNILVLGENSQRYSPYGCTCGENNDRDNLQLPGMQQELLEAVVASGRPTVLVLLNGRALSLVWAEENVNAIVEAWEPGMLGGQAVAEVLTGKVNPSGRLAVTVPRNVGQIQTVYNHKHSQYSRKFALSKSECLYPFGFGLSYSTFSYGEPAISRSEMTASESCTVSVSVRNDSSTDGTEVVQLYVRDEFGSVTRPVKELKGFRRVDLKAGESATVEFTVGPEELQCWGAGEEWTVEKGDFTLMVGSSSADKDLKSVSLKVI